MAMIKGKRFSFPGSGSPDVIGYRIYYEPTGTPLHYSDNPDPSPFVDIDLNLTGNLGDFFTNLDDRYDLGFVAIDDAGNESDMEMVYDVPLDFIAPEPPGPVTISDL